MACRKQRYCAQYVDIWFRKEGVNRPSYIDTRGLYVSTSNNIIIKKIPFTTLLEAV
ncbi:hypothetical protein ACGK9U_05775 [Mariniflexile sp. HNIBRBA6329]|uniref:hypothetical protein n=1 Tax=Mariniflexile sp. HNIBRBA6329 TaxID=3373088 RepID=UPI00374529AD